MPTSTTSRHRLAGPRHICALALLLLVPSITRAQCTPPSIAQQPVGVAGHFGHTAVFQVQAAGTGPHSFQWMRDGVPLTDDGRISGAGADRLRIEDLIDTDRGPYSVRVTNLCGEALSDEAQLHVDFCYADWDHSGDVTSQDFFDFLTDFFNPEYNCERACGFEQCVSQCFFEFLAAFFGGC